MTEAQTNRIGSGVLFDRESFGRDQFDPLSLGLGPKGVLRPVRRQLEPGVQAAWISIQVFLGKNPPRESLAGRRLRPLSFIQPVGRSFFDPYAGDFRHQRRRHPARHVHCRAKRSDMGLWRTNIANPKPGREALGNTGNVDRAFRRIMRKRLWPAGRQTPEHIILDDL